MARRKHEEEAPHEAWAIPYGDLLTLLLAFFVVLYSISSVNEGKYRVLSDAMSEAFGGAPKSMTPIQIGDKALRGKSNSDQKVSPVDNRKTEQSIGGTMRELKNPSVVPAPQKTDLPEQQLNVSGATGYAEQQLQQMGDQIEKAMSDLIDRKMVVLKRGKGTLEVQIRTDILFTSGNADVSESARPVLDRLAAILKSFPNPMRIEGHTDNVPIHTRAFPSNWELSAARAASVVHLFVDQGVDGNRMSVAGFAEFRASASNDTAEGRNQNRRVAVVVLMPDGAEAPAQLPAQPGTDAVADPAAAASPPSDGIAAVDLAPLVSPAPVGALSGLTGDAGTAPVATGRSPFGEFTTTGGVQ